jgi:predicted nuclease of predicted toxin-antitoxin system
LKLLFDQNLSRKLPEKLSDLYPNSSQVLRVNLDRATDLQVRDFAAAHGFIIATRDDDFVGLDALYGPPPKTIWLARDNACTAEYERLLRTFHEQIEAFAADQERSLLMIM